MNDFEHEHLGFTVKPEKHIVTTDQAGDVEKTAYWVVMKNRTLATNQTFRNAVDAHRWIEERSKS